MSISPHFETKALYNSLRMLGASQPVLPRDAWKYTDWRALSLDQLFDHLVKIPLHLDAKSFLSWAGQCDTPEELVELLGLEEEEESSDYLYLILFEIWRRLVPEKRCLSLIGDDMDHLIYAYDQGKDVDSVSIEERIVEWIRVLDSLCDQGASAQEALVAVEPYFAHDIPRFAMDFLLDMASSDERDHFVPLFEAVRPYCYKEPLWLKVVDLQFSMHGDIVRVRKQLGELVASVIHSSELDIDLVFELCEIAFELEKEELLLRLLEKIIPHLEGLEEINGVIELLEQLHVYALSSSTSAQLKDISLQIASFDKRQDKLPCIKQRLQMLVKDLQSVQSF